MVGHDSRRSLPAVVRISGLRLLPASTTDFRQFVRAAGLAADIATRSSGHGGRDGLAR